MKKRILILSLGLLFLASITFSLANISFSPGRVLSPAERKSLSSPREAFDIMQKLGLGISKADLDRFLATKFPERLAGVILISVEEDGRAYYIHPDTLEAIYLGRPHEALDILRELGLEDTLLDNNNDDIKRATYGFKYYKKQWIKSAIDVFDLMGRFDEVNFGKIKK